MSRGVVIPRVRALDGLRGAAVSGVLLFHGGYLTGGYLGVDLFFVLSGFLITSLLLAESRSPGSIGLGGFWARRARRLLPALAGLLVGVALYSAVHSRPAELAQLRGDALATLGYFANWRAIFTARDYFAQFNAPPLLQHTWSLAIEEQFYLVWPLVFVGLLAWWKASAPRAVLLVALLGALVSTALCVVLYDPSNVSRAYYGTDTRAAGILLGAALAAALVIWGPVRGGGARVALEIAGLVGVGVLAYAWSQLDGEAWRLYHGGLLLVGVAAAVIIAAAAHPTKGPIASLLSWRPLCLLGLISYGVYLWHWPVFLILDVNHTGLHGASLFAVRVAVTLAIAVASYHLLEMPIRRGAISSLQWRWLVPASAAALVVLILAVSVGAEAPANGAPDNVADAARRAAVHPGATKVMLVGDSVGYQIGVGMKQLRSVPPVVVLNRSIIGCTFPHVHHKTIEGNAAIDVKCDQGWKDAVDRFRPDVVLAIFQCCSGPVRVNGAWIRPCDADFVSYATREWKKAMAIWSSHGARVYATTAPYGSGEFLSPDNRTDLDCSNAVRRAVMRSAGGNVIDLAGWTCPGAPGPPSAVQCRVEADGVTLRPDSEHFRGAGAQIVSRWLLSQTRTAPQAAAHASASLWSASENTFTSPGIIQRNMPTAWRSHSWSVTTATRFHFER